MAVVLAFRLAIVLAPTVYRITQSSQPSNLTLIEWGLRSVWDQLNDPDSDPAEITSQLNSAGAESDPLWLVTDFTGTFELRKLQWRLSRAPAARVEDVDVCTFHFIKVSGGTPVSWAVDGSDLSTVEGAVNTFYNAIKADLPSFLHSDQFRWYRDGPAYWVINDAGTAFVPIGDNPAVRVTEVDVAGGAVAAGQLPPQVALTITERTSSRRHWGRFYLPAGNATSLCDATGIMTAAKLATWLGAAVTFYNSCRTASVVPVVWSIPKPERPKAGGGTLPAVDGKAYEVTSLQMDDIFDVIRSRRYQTSVTKTNTALT